MFGSGSGAAGAVPGDDGRTDQSRQRRIEAVVAARKQTCDYLLAALSRPDNKFWLNCARRTTDDAAPAGAHQQTVVQLFHLAVSLGSVLSSTSGPLVPRVLPQLFEGPSVHSGPVQAFLCAVLTCSPLRTCCR